MTKAEIVNEIAKKTGIEKAMVLASVESFMEIVKTSLANHEPVYLRGFGSFIIKQRAENSEYLKRLEDIADYCQEMSFSGIKIKN